MSLLLLLQSRYTIAVGQATEADTPQAISAQEPRAVGQSTETDTARPAVASKGPTVGLASGQQDFARPMTVGRAVAVGQASESDTAGAIAGVRGRTVNTVTETEVAQQIRITSTHLAQHVGDFGNEGTSSTTIVAAAARDCRAGDTLLVSFCCQSTGTGDTVSATVADNKGNTYQEDARKASTNRVLWVFSTKLTADLVAGDEITATLSVTKLRRNMTVDQFTGVNARDGASGTANGSSTTPSASKTPSNTNELIYGVVCATGVVSDTFTEDTDTTGGSWLTLTRVGTSGASATTLDSAYKVASVASQQTYDPTLGTSRIWAEAVAAYTPELRSVAVAQAQESDNAQAAAARHSVTLGQASEGETAQTISATRRYGAAQASEADSATVLSPAKSRTAGQSSEVGTAQPVTARRPVAAAQASEADAAQVITRLKSLSLGAASEADVGNAVAAQKLVGLGQAAETDEPRPIAATRSRPVAIAAADETDAAAMVAPAEPRDLGRASEADTAGGLGVEKRVAIVAVSEVDEPQALTVHIVRRIAVGQAVETDSPQPVSPPGTHNVSVAQSAEVENVGAIGVEKRLAITAASETDEPQALTVRLRRHIAVGQAAEADAAQPVAATEQRSLGQAPEGDTAGSTASVKLRVIGTASDAEIAQAILLTQRIALGLASEADTAGTTSVLTGGTEVGIAVEEDAGGRITVTVRRLAGGAPDLAGYRRALAGQRIEMGADVQFFIPGAETYPPGTALDPETGRPYDPTVAGDRDNGSEITRAGVYLRPAIQGPNAVDAAIGWIDQGAAVLDVAPEDYDAHDLDSATEVELLGERYEITDRDRNGIKVADRVLLYAKKM